MAARHDYVGAVSRILLCTVVFGVRRNRSRCSASLALLDSNCGGDRQLAQPGPAVASARHPHLTRERTQFVGQVRPGLVRWIGWDAQGRDRSALRTLGRLAVAFLSGLAAGAEHGCDLSPRMSVHAGLGHGIGQLRLATRPPRNRDLGFPESVIFTRLAQRRQQHVRSPEEHRQ
jgi:hypothetical protein